MIATMTPELVKLKDTLKTNGYSLTAPRQSVFRVLSAHEAQTMAELIARVGKDVDRASIYRIIALFEALGIAKRLPIGWKYKLELSDDFIRHHHHFSCKKCGRTFPLPEDRILEAGIDSLAIAQEFQPEEHQLEISGLCANCK
jgi:Fe2+ or Zn2+ uptake regulation protein